MTDQVPDSVDRRILRMLQKDGRITNAALAAKVGISAAACHARTRRLFQTGFVDRVTARLDPEKLGQGTCVIIGVVLDRSTPESFAAFETAALALELVQDCYLVTGEFDYFLKVRVSGLAALKRFHAEAVMRLPNVRQVRTFMVLKEARSDGNLVF